MKKFFSIVYDVINESDLLLEIIDSRMPKNTRNKFLENYIKKINKKLIIIINKSDLVEKDYLEKLKKEISKEYPCVFISAREHLGTLILKKKIMQHAPNLPVKVGIIGYPNTGKSSVINALKGRHSAKTSPIAGFTKAKQWIRVSKNILLIDTPGIIPYKETTEIELVLASAKSIQSIKDPERVALEILKLVSKKNPGILKEKYNIEIKKISFGILDDIAIAKKKLRKKGIPDIELVSRMIIQDWQRGKLK